MRNVCLLACVVMICDSVHAADLSGLPKIADVSGGVAVVVGDVDAKTLVSLHAGGRFVVHGLTGDQKRVVASYHKFDAAGNIQAYVARFEGGKWKISCVSDWDYRWEFTGNGSINVEIRVGTIFTAGAGKLHLPFRHIKHGSGVLEIDEETLKPLGVAKAKKSSIPAEIRKRESKFKGIGVRTAGDIGSSGQAGVRYMLRWETLGNNRDRKPKGPLPEPSMLRLVKIVEK
jgi:hypothetical protein